MSRYDVFVSYAEADRGWVEGFLLAALDEAGVRYRRLSVDLGASRLVEVERAVRESEADRRRADRSGARAPHRHRCSA